MKHILGQQNPEYLNVGHIKEWKSQMFYFKHFSMFKCIFRADPVKALRIKLFKEGSTKIIEGLNLKNLLSRIFYVEHVCENTLKLIDFNGSENTAERESITPDEKESE